MELKKLGIIGISDGNGHPYSWSAIINGYEPAKMKNCGFPVIPQYLAKEDVPCKKFHGANVHSIYTQSPSSSKKIAEASKIPHISKSLAELDLCTDAILLARDDAKNHKSFAEIFLKNEKPIYIDKPIALSVSDLDELYKISRYSDQIFSCSALRFADELYPTPDELASIGDLVEVNGQTPKSWEKYAVHLIDPLVHFMEFEKIKMTKSIKGKRGNNALEINWENGIRSKICNFRDKPVTVQLQYIGTKGSIIKSFDDAYSAFKKALLVFLKLDGHKNSKEPYDIAYQIVRLIEEGI